MINKRDMVALAYGLAFLFTALGFLWLMTGD